MKILIIGSGGMLGYAAFRYFRDQGHQVSGITRNKQFPGMVRMDAADESAIRHFLRQMSFDVIVNCAALLVKASEERHTDAVKINAWLPHYLSEYCRENGVYFIHISTDGVFSGKSGCYSENAVSDADSFYGRSKFLGEVSGKHALTVRSGFWGADVNTSGAGLFQWFMRQREPVSGYAKALFNGISNLEFAKFADSAIRNHWTGVYHLCASEIISKYEFLRLQKRVFSSETEIIKDERVLIDRSLQCMRTDIPYRQKSFEQMMFDLKNWLSGKTEFTV